MDACCIVFEEDGGFINRYPVSNLSEPMEDIDCGQMILTFDVKFSSDVSLYFEAANGMLKYFKPLT